MHPGTLRVYDRNEFFHAACHSRQATRAALDRHEAGEGLAIDVARATDPSPTSEPLPALSGCPICHQPATVARDVAAAAWYSVEGCACAGFFVAADILEWRLTRLTGAERTDLEGTIQGFRAMGREAWLSTGDGTMSGRLTIRSRRPDM